MNEQEIAKLRAAGFSDDDIRDYMADKQRQSGAATAPSAPAPSGDQGPELDPNAPSETMARARAQGIPTEGQESSFISDVATVALPFLAENAGKVAVGAGGLGAAYAANQVRKGMQARASAQAAQAAAQAAQAQATMEQARAAQQAAQGVQERFAQRQAAQAARTAPVAPQILDAQGRPIVRAPVAPVAPGGPAMTAPVAPQGPLPAGVTAGPAPFTPPQSPGIIDRATQIVRQVAASKVLQGAGRLAGPAGLAYSIYEAAPYLAQGGQELASGGAQQRMREAQRAALNAPTPAPLSAQEAQNLIASGDQRLINIYRNDPQVARLLGVQPAR